MQRAGRALVSTEDEKASITVQLDDRAFDPAAPMTVAEHTYGMINLLLERAHLDNWTESWCEMHQGGKQAVRMDMFRVDDEVGNGYGKATA